MGKEKRECGVKNHFVELIVTRVAMGVDVLARLHQQIQQVLVIMRDARQIQKPRRVEGAEPPLPNDSSERGSLG